jgi:hypothetical protein
MVKYYEIGDETMEMGYKRTRFVYNPVQNSSSFYDISLPFCLLYLKISFFVLKKYFWRAINSRNGFTEIIEMIKV